jgi:hypothetical protein
VGRVGGKEAESARLSRTVTGKSTWSDAEIHSQKQTYLRELGMMQCVVHDVVQDVEGEASGDDSVSDPVGEEGVSELCEGVLEGGEEGRGHDEAHAVHLHDQRR